MGLLNPLSKIKDKFSKDTFSIGLDIGSVSLKVIRLRMSKDSVELCDFSVEPIHSDLTGLLKKLNFGQPNDSVNISVSGSSALIRYVQFPRMNREELAKALKFEAQKHIPFAINEVNFDGYILKEDLPDNKMLVLIAAVKKEFLNQRLKLIKEAGLKVNVVDMDAIALFNAFSFGHSYDSYLKHKAVALLNIGAALSNLNISESGVLHLSRDIHIAGNDFTKKLADTLGIEPKAAEVIKLNPPDKEKSQVLTTVIDSVISRLVSEIRISFDYYESQSSYSVTKIFLSGGSSQLPGLKEKLANILGVEVEYWDPISKIVVSNTIDAQKLTAASASLGIAIGLGLHR